MPVLRWQWHTLTRAIKTDTAQGETGVTTFLPLPNPIVSNVPNANFNAKHMKNYNGMRVAIFPTCASVLSSSPQVSPEVVLAMAAHIGFNLNQQSQPQASAPQAQASAPTRRGRSTGQDNNERSRSGHSEVIEGTSWPRGSQRLPPGGRNSFARAQPMPPFA